MVFHRESAAVADTRGVRGENMLGMVVVIYPTSLVPPRETTLISNKQQRLPISGGDGDGVATHSQPWSSIILLEERPLRSLLVPGDLDAVFYDVRAVGTQRTRSGLLVAISVKVSCMDTLEMGGEDNAMSLAPT